MPPVRDTRDPAYAERLERLETAAWKRWLDVQAPYRWNLRRLGLGATLDLGCGIGRHLAHLPSGSVGVDHNEAAVGAARARGCTAFLPGELDAALPDARFDSLLAAHVLEHMTRAEAVAFLRRFEGRLRPGGRAVLITPQEAGFRSDASHVEWLDFAALGEIARALGWRVERSYSFPFPRLVGRVFPHNEFVVVARRS